MVLVWYVNHIGRKLRVSALIELVGNDTRHLLNTIYADIAPRPSLAPTTICAPGSGVITKIDHAALVRIAAEADCVLTLRPALGEFVPSGAPLFEISGAPHKINRNAVVSKITLGLERTLDQDMAYGLRMLVDIAERSLSDGPFLDPTTAVQAIDRLHDCLRQLASRVIPDGRYCDGSGEVRLVTQSMGWDDYVHLAFDEIRMAGAGSPQVARRLRAALEDLLTITPVERRRSLQEQMNLLQSGIQRITAEVSDRVHSSRGDPSGLG
jgi:uncharacterized membrane protein